MWRASMFKKIIVVCMFLFAVVSAGCSEQQTNATIPQKEIKQTESNVVKEEVVVLYRVPADGQEYLLPETVAVKSGKESLPEKALLALVNTPAKDEKNMLNIFPKGTKVLNFKVDKSLATVDFSKEIKNIMSGSYAELMLTTAVVNTLTEFPEIKQVQILVEGKKVATLKGHTDLLDPLERNTSLIKK